MIIVSFPCDSAVARIIPRIYDWYLSGACSPSPETTVAAPMLALERINILSDAIAMRAPAEAALLSINTITGIGELSTAVRIESASITPPP